MEAAVKPPPLPDLLVRGSHDVDLAAMVEIERRSFPRPWDEDALVRFLQKPNRCCYVAVAGRARVVGYLIVEVLNRAFVLLSLAVHPSHRRRGVARALIENVAARMRVSGRRKLRAEVRDTNLAAHLLLKAAGFRATDVLRDYVPSESDGRPQDAYVFERVEEPLPD